LKRKEKELVWLGKIKEYRESEKSLSQWCTDTGVAIHNMNYWLRKQAPITTVSEPETSLKIRYLCKKLFKLFTTIAWVKSKKP